MYVYSCFVSVSNAFSKKGNKIYIINNNSLIPFFFCSQKGDQGHYADTLR